MKSDSEAQLNRPPMLNRLIRPTRPAAATAVMWPGNISWLIAEAWPSTPMPAVVLQNSTIQISQNCGVLTA